MVKLAGDQSPKKLLFGSASVTQMRVWVVGASLWRAKNVTCQLRRPTCDRRDFSEIALCFPPKFPRPTWPHHLFMSFRTWLRFQTFAPRHPSYARPHLAAQSSYRGNVTGVEKRSSKARPPTKELNTLRYPSFATVIFHPVTVSRLLRCARAVCGRTPLTTPNGLGHEIHDPQSTEMFPAAPVEAPCPSVHLFEGLGAFIRSPHAHWQGCRRRARRNLWEPDLEDRSVRPFYFVAPKVYGGE